MLRRVDPASACVFNSGVRYRGARSTRRTRLTTLLNTTQHALYSTAIDDAAEYERGSYRNRAVKLQNKRWFSFSVKKTCACSDQLTESMRMFSRFLRIPRRIRVADLTLGGGECKRPFLHWKTSAWS